MSHITQIKGIKITNLKALKKAVKTLGGEFKENQKTFAYYAGQKGQCTHAASFKNCSYELGIIEEGKNYNLAWDSYYQGGLVNVLGQNANKLHQQYALFAAKEEAMMQGYHTTEKVKEDGTIELRIMVN